MSRLKAILHSEKTVIIFALVLIVVVATMNNRLALKNEGLKAEKEVWEAEKQELEVDNMQMKQEVYRLLDEQEADLKDIKKGVDELREIFKSARVETYTITAYAPGDPAATPGMCYSGDPNVTASGEPPIPGETAAATLPFGTLVYVPGRGVYRINDRGVGDNQIDLCVETREEALREVGRQKVEVVIFP